MKNKKLKARMQTVLRRAWLRDKARSEAMAVARIERGRYECSICKNIVGSKEIDIDHINPVVPLTGWVNFDNFIERLFCDKSELRVLCKECHRKITKLQSDERVAIRKQNKEKDEGGL